MVDEFKEINIVTKLFFVCVCQLHVNGLLEFGLYKMQEDYGMADEIYSNRFKESHSQTVQKCKCQFE